MYQKRDENMTFKSESFDPAGTLRNLDGDIELFQGLVLVFLEESASLLEEIRDAIGLGDDARVQRAAHTLKGTSGNLGARGTMDAAFRLEVLARDGKVEDFPRAFEDLRAELDRLTRDLRRTLESP